MLGQLQNHQPILGREREEKRGERELLLQPDFCCYQGEKILVCGGGGGGGLFPNPFS